MKQFTISQIEKEKIITIVRGVPKEKLIPLAEAMYAGGIRLMECTFDAKGDIKDEEIASNIKMLSEHFGDRILIGAGTVLSKKQVSLTKEAGGRFIISPDSNADVIKKTVSEGLVSIPGALTPSEISKAHRLGADFVKVFPVNLMGGAGYIKALKAPLSNIKLLAVNGVSAENMSEYLLAGASGFGIGSGIVNKKMIKDGDFEGITKLAKSYTSLI